MSHMRLTSSDAFVQANLDIGYASSDLHTALKRMRTGVRMTWRDGKYFVIGAKGESWGAHADRTQALTMYMLCCSLADLPLCTEHLYVPGHTG